MINVNFAHGEAAAKKDKVTLTGWERGQIDTKRATKWINNNNNLLLTEEEFVEMAHSLGYFRETKKENKNEKD